jgi:hypothetical protein
MSSGDFPGSEIRGSDIPKRQQPESMDLVTQYAIMMIPLNGKPYAVDEEMLFDDASGNEFDGSNNSDI